MLEDPEFRRRVHEAIEHAELVAEAAVEGVVEEFASLLEQSGDAVFAERVADLRDLATQLRRRLQGEPCSDLSDPTCRGAVVAVPEVLPSLVIRMWRAGVSAAVVENGTALSHSAILARSLSLPVIRVAALDPLRAHGGARVLVDADSGVLVVEPGSADVEARTPYRIGHPVDADAGMPARLWLNVVTPEELGAVEWDAVEGVGLFRTEAVFLEKRNDFPAGDEQEEVYAQLFALCGDRPVTVRTLDAGGDKPLGYLSLGPEANPQLGLRAHRLYRFHPELLITQLRAILRAGLHHAGPLRLMYPLVATLDDWRFLRGLTQQAKDSLRLDGLAFRDEFACGLMVETPSAVWSFRDLIRDADFASIGTNDLVQYVLAVDRSNANVADLYRPEDPVVLRVLRELVEVSRAASKDLTLCGEIAADHRLLPLLLGLGIRDFSVAVPNLTSVRRSLTGLSTDACEALADECLRATGVTEVRQALDQWHEKSCPWEPWTRGTVIDPVCRMAVDPDSTPYRLEHQGKHYFFCQRRCMDAFQRHLADS